MSLRYYSRILETCEPFVISRAAVLPSLDIKPFQLPIPESHRFDPTRTESGAFIQLVKRLDDITYGPLGLSMPSWVFYDCAAVPGVIFGFARPAQSMEPWVLRALGVSADYQGPVPVSLLIAIPRVNREEMLVYTLCSINQVAAGAAPEGIWRLTLAFGTRVLGCTQLLGTCQWRAPQLGLFAGLGPLDLVTAWTPAHDNPTTVTFRVSTNADARQRLLRGDSTGPEGIDRYLDADNFEQMKALQAEIEGGLRVAVVGPAEIRGAETRVPLRIHTGMESLALERGVQFTPRFQG